jgi:hypothetical protein
MKGTGTVPEQRKNQPRRAEGPKFVRPGGYRYLSLVLKKKECLPVAPRTHEHGTFSDRCTTPTGRWRPSGLLTAWRPPQEEPNFSPYLRVAQNNLNLAAHQGRQRYREFIRMERSRTDARHRPGAGGLAAFGSLAAFSGAAQGPAALRSLPDRGKKLALVRSHVERSSARR